jgi:hypothetical protein
VRSVYRSDDHPTERIEMGCLFVLMAAFAPRLLFVFIWIARPSLVDAALLGLVFLPFTTLMWLLLGGTGRMDGFDWVWVGLAVVLDLGHYANTYAQRGSISGGTSTA